MKLLTHLFTLTLFFSLTAGCTENRAKSTGTLVVYKTPSCGCCQKWVEHMEANGFTTEVHDMDDLSQVKQMSGIQHEYSSCHTAIIDGYVVEGHVPAEFVSKMLSERPDITGITVPGMPIGSPGMEGPNPVEYQIYSFDKEGQLQVFGTAQGQAD